MFPPSPRKRNEDEGLPHSVSPARVPCVCPRAEKPTDCSTRENQLLGCCHCS